MTEEEMKRFGLLPSESTETKPNYPPKLEVPEDCAVKRFEVSNERYSGRNRMTWYGSAPIAESR